MRALVMAEGATALAVERLLDRCGFSVTRAAAGAPADGARLVVVEWEALGDGAPITVEALAAAGAAVLALVETPHAATLAAAWAAGARDAFCLAADEERLVAHARALAAGHCRLPASDFALPDALERHPHPAWIFEERTLRLVAVNDAMVRTYGWSRAELIGMNVRQLRPDDEVARWDAHLAAGWKPLHNGVWRHRKKDGTTFDVEIVSQPMHGAPRPARIVIARDVTAERRLHEAQRNAIADYRSLIDRMPDGVFTYRHDDASVVYANAALAALLGCASANELIGTDARLFVTPQDRHIVERRRVQLGQPPFSTDPIALRFLARDGSLRWVESRAQRIGVGDDPLVTVMVRDLTARHSAEEALKRSEERFVKFFHVNPACSTVTRLSDNTFVDVNERFCALTGYAREELIGKTGIDVGLWPDPEQRARIEASIRAGGRARDVEVRLAKKSGDPIDVRMSLETFTIGGVECVFALSHDITEEKRLEEQLRQSQKMEAIGRLAGGIAHDFNNLLTAINGYSEILARDLPPGTGAHDAASHILHSARRASSLTEQLLLFTRRQPQRGRVVAINDVVYSMSAMLARLIGEDVELVLELGCYVGCVRADPAQIEQVLLNLVVNARDAMPDGGRLVLETVAAAGIDGRPGVRLTVRDSGCGIAPEIRPHIFEPFFTTKQVGKGTGLGLSIVYSAVAQAGGSVSVESVPGHGAAFHIWLPRVDEPADVTAVTPSAEALRQRGGETVLLVEDDEDVRDFVEFVLRRAGYRVLAAAAPADGLQFAEAHDGEIHLLLSDIVMPEMNGNEMAARAQALRPAMKVLHMSGYPAGRQRNGGYAPGGAFLQKPFSVETLTQAVRTMLDGGAR